MSETDRLAALRPVGADPMDWALQVGNSVAVYLAECAERDRLAQGVRVGDDGRTPPSRTMHEAYVAAKFAEESMARSPFSVEALRANNERLHAADEALEAQGGRVGDDGLLAAALEELKDWKAGRRSYTNLGPNPPYTPDVIAAMDAQEVVKLSAYITALAAQPAPPALDRERLARALHVVYHDGKPGEPDPTDTTIYCDEDAAAIADAYEKAAA